MYATDGNSLGDRAGIMSIDFNHQVHAAMPEHGIVAWFLVLRMPPIYHLSRNPIAGDYVTDWAEITGEPRILKAAKPVQPDHRKYVIGTPSGYSGWEPAGQHLRSGWNSVDRIFKTRNSLPIMTPAQNNRYHPDVDNIFNSTALGHFWGRLYFSQPTESPVPEPMYSVMAGD